MKKEIQDIENKMRLQYLEDNCFKTGLAYSPGELFLIIYLMKLLYVLSAMFRGKADFLSCYSR